MNAFLSLPIIWVFLTVAIYLLAQKIHRKLNRVFTTPILLTILILILLLYISGLEFEVYHSGGKFISFFLGPSVVALGVLFHEQYDQIKNNLSSFLIAVIVGGISSILSVLLVLFFFKAPDYLLCSLAPKSVTTPIAIEIAKSISGTPAITAGVVIVVGILGNAFGVCWLRFFGIKSKVAIGVALGTASHGIGTARALEENKLAGVYSALAFCINGVFTAILVPLIIGWFIK